MTGTRGIRLRKIFSWGQRGGRRVAARAFTAELAPRFGEPYPGASMTLVASLNIRLRDAQAPRQTRS